MAEFSIGEVEKLTGLKAHVIRYWEEAVPVLRPRKDDLGKRLYGTRDIELLLRVKFLVQEKKFTLEGAGERLVTELIDTRFVHARESIAGMRAELLKLYDIVQRKHT
jgi:DNA-binding transcriptional MerR regulator